MNPPKFLPSPGPLEVSVESEGFLDLQWQVSESPDGPFQPMPGHNSTTLSITPGGVVLYVRCRATNDGGVAFSPVRRILPNGQPV